MKATSVKKNEGPGIFYWPDVTKYEGGWKDGKQPGIGAHYGASGTAEQGLWQNGIRLC